jgi:hypothetical protein
MAADEAILIQKTTHDMGIPQAPIPLLCDNTAAEALLKNPIETGSTKYLEIHWHFCRGLIESKKIEVFHVRRYKISAGRCFGQEPYCT